MFLQSEISGYRMSGEPWRRLGVNGSSHHVGVLALGHTAPLPVALVFLHQPGHHIQHAAQ